MLSQNGEHDAGTIRKKPGTKRARGKEKRHSDSFRTLEAADLFGGGGGAALAKEK